MPAAPALDGGDDETVLVRIGEMKKRRRPSALREARLVAVERLVAPEEIEVAGLHPQCLGLEQALRQRRARNLPREPVLQQDLLDEVDDDVRADAAQLRIDDEIAALFAGARRNGDRHEGGHDIGIVVKLERLLETGAAGEHPQHLVNARLGRRLPVPFA